MDGAVNARILAAVLMFAAFAAPTAAQEPHAPSLAELARQAEAAKKAQPKAKKSYTNADLHAASAWQNIPTAAPAGTANATAKPAAADSAGKDAGTADSKAAADPGAQNMPEEFWRQRGDFIRGQVEKAKSEIARLNGQPQNPSAALEARKANDIKTFQQMLDGAMKQWAQLEGSAQASKINMAWIGPAPQ